MPDAIEGTGATDTTDTTAIVTMGPTFHAAAAAVLLKLGYKPIQGNGWPMRAWMWCEKSHPNGAWTDEDGVVDWNPLNTTENEPGDEDENGAGVKIYTSEAEGVAAIVATLTNGYYPTLVKALEDADPALFFSEEGMAQIKKWGTDPDEVKAVYQSMLKGTII